METTHLHSIVEYALSPELDGNTFFRDKGEIVKTKGILLEELVEDVPDFIMIRYCEQGMLEAFRNKMNKLTALSIPNIINIRKNNKDQKLANGSVPTAENSITQFNGYINKIQSKIFQNMSFLKWKDPQLLTFGIHLKDIQIQ